MSKHEMTLEEFLGHKSSNYTRGNRLENWKKRDVPIIDTWIHTKSKIAAIWQHPQPKIVVYTKRDTQSKREEVFGGTWNCWEKEEVLQDQRYRDEETGRRTNPPTICPECLLLEWLFEQVQNGEIDWCKPIFRYEAADTDDPVVVHAGGMIGLFGKRNLSDGERKQLKEARIRQTEAWREVQIAKLSYVFSVVDNDHPEAGVCTTIEPNLLGDKIKVCISKSMMDLEDEGNPFLHPFCIQWSYHPKEPDFKNKYDASKRSKIPLTEEIRKLIVDTDPPSYGRILARQNPYDLRALLESACLLKDVPWDKIFGRACKSWDDNEGKEGSKADGTDFDPSELESKPVERSKSKRKVDDSRICEDCGEVIPKASKKCPGCGSVAGVFSNPEDDDLPYG